MSSYGGPIETPNMDRIAAQGVRYTQWHTTALCSLTRSSPVDWSEPHPQQHGVHHRDGEWLPTHLACAADLSVALPLAGPGTRWHPSSVEAPGILTSLTVCSPYAASTRTDREGDMGRFETIEAGDTTTRLYEAGEVRPGAPGVVVFHPWWGLNDDIVAYSDRLAAAGFAVVAPDLYRGPVASTIEEAERLSGSLDEAASAAWGSVGNVADAIAIATIDRLADQLGSATPLAAVGFSMGAVWAMWSPAERDRLAASVVYYGSLKGPSLSRAAVPVLGHFAETDPYESDEAVTAFEGTLRSASRDVVIHRYPGTGHWFAEPSRDAYRPADADLAFERTVAFLGHHLP